MEFRPSHHYFPILGRKVLQALYPASVRAWVKVKVYLLLIKQYVMRSMGE